MAPSSPTSSSAAWPGSRCALKFLVALQVAEGNFASRGFRREHVECGVRKLRRADEDAGIVDGGGISWRDAGNLHGVAIDAADGFEIVVQFQRKRRQQDFAFAEGFFRPGGVAGKNGAVEVSGPVSAEGKRASPSGHCNMDSRVVSMASS